jgi:hypothetical protein
VSLRAVAGRVAVVSIVVLAGCGAELPEADSPAATLYRTRCSGCHRLYHPGTMTGEMWRFQVERMQGELARRGMPQLSPTETDLLLRYLGVHASDGIGSRGGAPPQGDAASGAAGVERSMPPGGDGSTPGG